MTSFQLQLGLPYERAYSRVLPLQKRLHAFSRVFDFFFEKKIEVFIKKKSLKKMRFGKKDVFYQKFLFFPRVKKMNPCVLIFKSQRVL